ncbi:MAG: GNAT family N-acetyltransferase, partial [Chitinophagaceae bacterium]
TMQVHTTKGPVTIREALPSDLPQLVSLHLTSFNATYPDHSPKPGYAFREKQWNLLFSQKPGNWFCYVAQLAKDEVVGFVTGHDFYDAALPYKGQLDKIHILKPYQQLGLGSVLLFHVVRRFLHQGISSMILFADPANPAIVFYDGLQGERLQTPGGDFSGAYGWKDLQALEALLCQRL